MSLFQRWYVALEPLMDTSALEQTHSAVTAVTSRHLFCCGRATVVSVLTATCFKKKVTVGYCAQQISTELSLFVTKKKIEKNYTEHKY